MVLVFAAGLLPVFHLEPVFPSPLDAAEAFTETLGFGPICSPHYSSRSS
jgi:hypothetical protein